MYMSQGPQSHILMGGGGGGGGEGVQVIFLGLKFWLGFFWVYERCQPSIFWGHEKKTEGCFWVVKKGQGIYLGMLKKVVIFFLGRQILKLWFFWE